MDGGRPRAGAEAEAPRRRAVLCAGRLPGHRADRGGADGDRRQGARRPDPAPARRRAPQARGQGLRVRAHAAVRRRAADGLPPLEGPPRSRDRRLRAPRAVGLLLRRPRRSRGADRMEVLRPHLALTVSSVERSAPFYEALFGTAPSKVKPGYAKFDVAEPALNFTLNEGVRGDTLGAFNHAGIQVASTD